MHVYIHVYIFLSLYMYATGDNTFVFTLYITELIHYFAIFLILLCSFYKILLDLTFVTNVFYSIFSSSFHILYYLHHYLQLLPLCKAYMSATTFIPYLH